MLELGFARAGLSDFDAKIDENYPKILAHYADCLSDNTRFFDGATDAVQRLRDAGYRTGICTNKPVDLATRLIDELGATQLFDSLIGANSLPVRKPDPAPYVLSVKEAGGQVENSVLIGDTITDHKTATAAGVPSILVTFGPGGDAVADLNPDALLHSYRD